MAKADTPDQKSDKRDERSPYQRWIDILTIEADLSGTEEAEFVLDDVLSGIIDAETMEDAFEASTKGPESGKGLVDVELAVKDVVIYHSRISTGRFKFVAKVEATRLDTGEDVTFRVGAPNVVALYWKAREFGKLPLECVITERDLGDGKGLLNLKPLPKRVELPKTETVNA